MPNANDFLFCLYWAISFVGALLGIGFIVIFVLKTVTNRKYPPIFKILESAGYTIGGLIMILVFAISLPGALVRPAGEISFENWYHHRASLGIPESYLYSDFLTHSYWKEDIEQLVINDIAPAVYDQDILNCQTDLFGLAEYSEPPNPYRAAEISMRDVRPFSYATATQFEIKPFVRTTWQWNPMERLKDDRAYREWVYYNTYELPQLMRITVFTEAEKALKQYLSTTNRPNSFDARWAIEQRLQPDWYIGSCIVTPKTNNWEH
ncbi:TPA: hypothetical protein DCR79_02330 [Patescibacteria group bacterium]|nr:hypothetical protein [Patescibacteria group bacterium]